jgi:RNA polymerase sigma-70 factor (ECF subfamily)
MTEQSELYKKLEVAVDGLDEKHRLPLILRYVHQLTIPEIAKILELNEGTVHSRLHHAREKLGRHLGRYQ